MRRPLKGMRFPSSERFFRYCVSKRRTYLRQLFDRHNPRAFFDFWKAEYELTAGGECDISGASREQMEEIATDSRWLLLQDLHQLARNVVPEFAPTPASVLRALPQALNQVRMARSMLIVGEPGVGKEQLAILLHVLTGRSGALVRISAAELRQSMSALTRQMMPERGTVFIGDLEQIGESAQEPLLAFLNRDARRRDLLIITSSPSLPRDLTSKHGIRRDLFVRVSQTEVRLPPLEVGSEDARGFVADVLYDLVRVPPDRLPALRNRAQNLAEQWRREAGSTLSPAYDLFAEALSYVMWDQRRVLARALLASGTYARASEEAGPGQFRGLLHRVAKRYEGGGRLHSVSRSTSAGSAKREAPSKAGAAASAPGESAGEAAEAAPAVPTSLTRDALLRLYYRALLREESGDLGRVAARAGRSMRTLHAELTRLGIRPTAEPAEISTERS